MLGLKSLRSPGETKLGQQFGSIGITLVGFPSTKARVLLLNSILFAPKLHQLSDQNPQRPAATVGGGHNKSESVKVGETRL